MSSGAGEALGFHRSRVPLVGAAVDCVASSARYLAARSLTVTLHPQPSRAAVTGVFLGGVCLLLGAVAHVKVEPVRADGRDLPHDLHLLLLSKDLDLYVDDIDTSKVRWCAEAADLFAVALASLLAGLSNRASAPLRSQLLLPWLGAALRGLLLRQSPAAAALLYTAAVVDDSVNAPFAAAFCVLFLLEIRFWVEMARLLRSRQLDTRAPARPAPCKTQSDAGAAPADDVEVLNYVY